MPITPRDEKMLCANCEHQLDGIARLNIFKNEDLALLRKPRRIMTTWFPLHRDSGATEIVAGYRIQHNDALGPAKGGIRMHEASDLEEVAELAFLMSLKTSLVGLPYGGAKGAIAVDPKKLSQDERARLVRGYVRQIASIIGPDRDIPAPDVNTNPELMMIMLDEYEKIVGHQAPAAFTGKPVERGGSEGRDTSTSQGGFYIIEKIFADKTPSDTRIAIQGFGNVGMHLAELLYGAGQRVVAVSDSQTGIFSEDGLPIPDLVRWKQERKSFADRAEKKITNDELLTLDVDMLIPAALGGVITEYNAEGIKAPIILEMANAPITPEADAMLHARGVTIIPDILANSGGVIVSYFEWLQNRAHEHWSKEKVCAELKTYMSDAYNRVINDTATRNVSLRTACYIVAIKRILDAEKTRNEM